MPSVVVVAAAVAVVPAVVVVQMDYMFDVEATKLNTQTSSFDSMAVVPRAEAHRLHMVGSFLWGSPKRMVHIPKSAGATNEIMTSKNIN